MGEAETESLILWLVVLKLLAGGWVGGCVGHRDLFRACWKHIFCIPGCENVSPGDGSDCQTG